MAIACELHEYTHIQRFSKITWVNQSFAKTLHTMKHLGIGYLMPNEYTQFLKQFSSEPGLFGFPLDFPSLIHNLCILSGVDRPKQCMSFMTTFHNVSIKSLKAETRATGNHDDIHLTSIFHDNLQRLKADVYL